MRFVADLHIHSRFSRATSKDLDLVHLHQTAQRKGIRVVGTGDFTHPAWRAELREQLVPAEEGLFRLRDDLARAADEEVPGACRGEVRFLLSVEISSIYKRGDRTRKVHNLVYSPSFEVAEAIAGRLGKIGNITSDGRPILGLDSRDLLEVVLSASEDAFLVPAHIWTPWFSALGAQSGFDTIKECFGDLAGHVFAAETGLSSDPAMNWRLSQLDRLAIVSSSDAHSPEKLGREASLFDCDLSYFGLRDALRDRREGFAGTVEFFPEEGKYHFDGHRKCEVVLTPREAKEQKGICPVCKKPLTAGVAGRVEELSDRPEGARPAGAKPFVSLVPLGEVLGEVCESGAASGRVRAAQERLLGRIGPELSLLMEAPIEELDREGPPLLAEAIARMRRGEVIARPGYDGEYGVIRVFPDEERRRLLSQTSFGFMGAVDKSAKGQARGGAEMASLFDGGAAGGGGAASDGGAASGTTETVSLDGEGERDEGRGKTASLDVGEGSAQRAEATGGVGTAATGAAATGAATATAGAASGKKVSPFLDGLNEAQARAVMHDGSPLVIVAGPGTGKTKTVVHRIARLIRGEGVSPRAITTITFTKKAAGELRERLTGMLGEQGSRVEAMTFHALGQRLISAFGEEIGIGRGSQVADEDTARGCLEQARSRVPGAPGAREARDRISWAKAHLVGPAEADAEIQEVFEAYEAELRARGLLDFDDLVGRAVELLERSEAARAFVEERARWLFVDEYQDVQLSQYRLVRLLAPEGRSQGLTVVGDPDQAIYGFRGSDPAYFERFEQDYPDAARVTLTESYRCPATVVRAATRVIEQARGRQRRPLSATLAGGEPVVHLRAASAEEEADRIAAEIEDALGGTSLLTATGAKEMLALDEIAVLFRTSAQAAGIGKALERAGIPYFVRGEEALEERFEPQKVALLTLHASKGLEFPLVFVTGCEDGLLPLRLPGIGRSDVEEERRLLYVGMTRAKRRLVLTSAQRRTLFGQGMQNAVCPFLVGLPRDVIVEAAMKRRARKRQMSLF